MKGIVYAMGGVFYDLLDSYFERTRYSEIRKKLLSHLKGAILDAGCGTGKNFSYYHPEASVLAVDQADRMLAVARARAKQNITVKKMGLTALQEKDGSFDIVIATFVLCTMPQELEKQALEELIRVTKPGGKLFFLEYTYARDPVRRAMMKVTSFLPKMLYGMRFNSTLPLVGREMALEIERNEFVHDDVVRLIVARKRGERDAKGSKKNGPGEI